MCSRSVGQPASKDRGRIPDSGDAGKPFATGEVEMHFWSTSAVGVIERAKNDFEPRTSEYPSMGEPPKGLPAGGNSGMLVSTSDDPKQVEAAWKFLKFCTSGVGAAAVAETTGYMPPNKAANELLSDFYANNPNKHTAVRQAGLLRDWIGYSRTRAGSSLTLLMISSCPGSRPFARVT